MRLKQKNDASSETCSHLTIKVQPRSSTNGIVEIQADGTVRVKLNAPPVEGKANDALVHLLAEVLEIKKNAIEIKAGQTARLKIVRIDGISQDIVRRKLQEQISK